MADLEVMQNPPERFVKDALIGFIRRDHPLFKASHIKFSEVAGSRADVLAREAYRGNEPVDGWILLEEVEAILRAKK